MARMSEERLSELRSHRSWDDHGAGPGEVDELLDEIEALKAENDRLKDERDAARADYYPDRDHLLRQIEGKTVDIKMLKTRAAELEADKEKLQEACAELLPLEMRIRELEEENRQRAMTIKSHLREMEGYGQILDERLDRIAELEAACRCGASRRADGDAP